jgi:hypothetical protein
VWDEGQGASAKSIGRNDLYRVPGAAALEELSIPLNPSQGNRLRVVIDNGDSPPLTDVRLSAVAQRVSLLFSLPSRGDAAPAGTLLFGGGRARAPQYDLARLQTLLRPPQPGSHAALATDLYESSPARLGAIAQNATFGASPTLSFAMRPGSAVDPRLYTHRRSVRLEPSADGLSVLRLTIEDLAKAEPDLRDVRIVDGELRQWAYVEEQGSLFAMAPLTIRGTKSEHGVSEYELRPPAAPSTLDRIELQIQAEFFDREFELHAVYGDTEAPLTRGRLQRRAGDLVPPTIDVSAWRIDALKLKVYDGDDAPLELVGVQGRFPTADLYVAAPAGDYTLFLGYGEDVAPSYELAQVRSAVLAAFAGEAQIGDLEENPQFSARARISTGDGPQHVLLWAALILAVGGLSVVTLRMARRQPSDQSHRDGEEATRS